MKHIFLPALLALATALTPPATAQSWTKVPALDGIDCTALGRIGDVLYVGTGDNRVLTSGDEGVTWRSATLAQGPHYVEAMTVYKGRIYAGSTAGLFSSADTGRTWTRTDGLTAYEQFAEYQGQLYCAFAGYGVQRLDTVTQRWQPVRQGLHWATAFSLVATDRGLLASAGANGDYYLYTGTGAWTAHSFSSGGSVGLTITDMIDDGTTLWAGAPGRLYRSDDTGRSWTLDGVDLRRGGERRLHMAGDQLYVFSNILPELTWVHHRSLTAAPGTSWGPGEELLPDAFTYTALTVGNRTYLAQSRGLAYKDFLPTSAKPDAPLSLTIAPNPSPTGTVTLTAGEMISEVVVRNALGQSMQTVRPSQRRVSLSGLPSGAYLVEAVIAGKRVVKRVVVS